MENTDGPFRATRVWNAVVDYTREHVDIRSHTVKRKSYNDCFTGADVADVVFHCLRSDRVNCPNSVSREQAVKMCQLFLDLQIVSVVHSEHGSLCLFEDSSTTLYCFTSKSEKKIEYDHKRVKCNKPVQMESCDLDASSISRSSRRSRIGREITRLSNKERHNQTTMASTPRKCYTHRPALPDQSLTLSYADHAGTKATSVIRDVTNEILVNSLLELVEIPVLDDILQYITTTSGCDVNNGSIFLDLTHYNQEDEDDLCKRDSWWQSAHACLVILAPDAVCHIMKSSLSEACPELQKIRFFNCLADKLASIGPSLWPTAFSDIHLGLFRLLMESRCSDALRVLQLSFALLHATEQAKLHKLLMFLRSASDITAVQLSVLDVNNVVVERAFCDIFFSSHLLTRHQIGQILAFAIANCDVICELPSDVQNVIDVRLGKPSLHITDTSLSYSCQVGKLGQVIDSVDVATNNSSTLHVDSVDKSYCERVSVEEYQAQCQELTDRALVDVMNSILDNTQISLKEKKRHLKQFMKHHSRLGLLHFSDIV